MPEYKISQAAVAYEGEPLGGKGFSCKHCVFWVEEGWKCTQIDGKGAPDPGKIHPDGCCNMWTDTPLRYAEAAEEPMKMPKGAVVYIHPKSESMLQYTCEECSMIRGTGRSKKHRCTAVEGHIDEKGSCQVWMHGDQVSLNAISATLMGEHTPKMIHGH